jgi:hypothetical protein
MVQHGEVPMRSLLLLSVLAVAAITPARADWYESVRVFAEAPEQPISSVELCSSNVIGTCNGLYSSSPAALGAETSTLTYYPSNPANGYVVTSAFAEANLSNGTVRARSIYDNQFNYGAADAFASAAFGERLQFSVTGANESTVTKVSLTVSLDGSGNLTEFSAGATSYDSGFTKADNLAFSIFSNGQSQSFIGDWISTGPNTFSGEFDLYGANPVVFVSMALATRRGGDYSHTGAFSFEPLAQGISFVSESNVFLTSAVPEPSAIAMFCVGMLVVVNARSRLSQKPKRTPEA